MVRIRVGVVAFRGAGEFGEEGWHVVLMPARSSPKDVERRDPVVGAHSVQRKWLNRMPTNPAKCRRNLLDDLQALLRPHMTVFTNSWYALCHNYCDHGRTGVHRYVTIFFFFVLQNGEQWPSRAMPSCGMARHLYEVAEGFFRVVGA